MLRRRRPKSEQQGFVLVGALVLIALLFFIETVLAVAITTTLHALDVDDQQSAIRYAAESAAARGIAEMTEGESCPGGGAINGVAYVVTCFSVSGITAASASAVAQIAVPASAVGPGGCANVPVYDFGEQPTAVWTVLAWRTPAGGPKVTVWTDDTQNNCSPPPSTQPCVQSSSTPAQPLFFACQPSGSGEVGDWLHVASTAPISLGPFIVRSALAGSDKVGIAVGQAATELDEAEVLLNGNTEDLWETLLQ